MAWPGGRFLHDHRARTRFNPSSAMIQENYRVVEFRELRPFKFGQAQPPIRFAQEAVIYIVRVGVNSSHRPVRTNAPPGAEVPRNVEFDGGAVLIAHNAVIHVCTDNIPSSGCSI